MNRATIESSKEWRQSLEQKVRKGKLYLYKNNVPQNPILFKV